MESKIIVMLTHNDKTVGNALEVFESCKDLPIDFWGFKDIGLDMDGMRKLHRVMKEAGKTSFLEVVTFTPEACLAGARLAVELEFDYLMGTLFYPEVWEFLRDKTIQYFPFVGDVSGNPSVLKGSVEGMLAQAEEFAAMGIPGVDLLAYRLEGGDPQELAKKFSAGAKPKVVIAGSISSPERIAVVNEINPWAFTMGSALFTSNFVENTNFRENLVRVLEIMDLL